MNCAGLLGFRTQGRYRATFNQFDSDRLGYAIAEFIASLAPKDLHRMAHRVASLRWVKRSERSKGQAQHEGRKALKAVLRGHLRRMTDDTAFGASERWCEWVYILDFGNMTLEIRHSEWCSGVFAEVFTFEKVRDMWEHCRVREQHISFKNWMMAALHQPRDDA
jgi:hypothetical protein